MSSQPVSFCVTFSVTSGVFAARKALAKLLEGLSPLQLDSEDADSIKMVLAQVLNNIVEHLYPNPRTRAYWGSMHFGGKWIGHCVDRYRRTNAKWRTTNWQSPQHQRSVCGFARGRVWMVSKKMFAQNITHKRTGSINTLAFHPPIRIKISA